MACSVKSIPANFMLRVKRIRNAVEVRMRRHFLMERRVEHRNLRYVRQMNLACVYAAKVVRIMKGGDVNVVTNTFHDIISNKNRSTECFTAMHDAVTDGIDLALVG